MVQLEYQIIINLLSRLRFSYGEPKKYMKKILIGLFVLGFMVVGFKAFASVSASAVLGLTSSDNGRTFEVVKGQIITVTLCNPGDGGYQFDTPQYDSSILSLISHINVPINPPNPPGYSGGCYGNDVFKFQALKVGTTELEITASRGWSGGDTANMFNSTFTVVTSSNNPVISGVSGPQTLNVNQAGTWKVTASSSNGGSLSYAVVWGDEITVVYAVCSNGTDCSSSQNPQQSATFTHSYSQAGTYTPTFTVTSANTIMCVTTPCPSNGGSAITSLTVKVNALSIDDGCLSGYKYSYTTGQLCPNITPDDGCKPGYNYSPITGLACINIIHTCSSSGASCIIPNTITRTLKVGTKGDDVKILQTFLGITSDGVFGPFTESKVKVWQESKNLTSDGIFGNQSITKAGLE